MSTPRKRETDLRALVEKWRDGKTLTPEEIEAAIAALEAKAQAVAQSGAADPNAQPEPGDLVSFTMPRTVMGGAYHINGQPYAGPCEASFEIYQQLAYMHQADVQGYRELFEKRGSDMFGLSNFINWVPPQVPYRLVRRAARVTDAAA